MQVLIVRQPFNTYRRGDLISGETLVRQILQSASRDCVMRVVLQGASDAKKETV